MKSEDEIGGGHFEKTHGVDLRFGSNAVRLPAAEWLAVAAILAAIVAFAPAAWQHVETFEPGADYRVPYDLSNDYWLFSRWSRAAAERALALVVGDSVVWGQYVARDETLSHCLNQEAGRPRFANLGLDGTHPAALAGLIEYYGGALAGRNVLLHCNLLWTASKKHDLATEKEFAFNHPALVPQFVPRIPCYGEPYSRRVGIAIEREIPFFAWTNHLRLAYLGRTDLPAWTLEHPYAAPLEALRQGLPTSDDRPQHGTAPWTGRGIERQSFEWVNLDTSLQWRSFQRAVETLRARGSRVFVLVGPFNEHMLDEKGLARYGESRRRAEAWLRETGVPCFAPEPLPSDLYADASHPLAGGYALLARRLMEDNGFRQFLGAD